MSRGRGILTLAVALTLALFAEAFRFVPVQPYGKGWPASAGPDTGKGLPQTALTFGPDSVTPGVGSDSVNQGPVSDSVHPGPTGGMHPDTLAAKDSAGGPADTLSAKAPDDSLAAGDSIPFNPRDTIRIPDSLEQRDPFRFRYYFALRDSLTRAQVKDSLVNLKDTAELMRLDSLILKDSLETLRWKHEQWWNSLSKKEKRDYLREKEIERKIHIADSLDAIRDSIKARRDSIFEATPRILETYVLPDSMQYKRIINWTLDRRFDDLQLQPFDTSYNHFFYDFSFYRDDVNATYLGVAGSAVQKHDFFKRDRQEGAFFYDAWTAMTYTPETMPFYNTKTPYTRLWYSGTLFNGRKKEELNVGVLSTQNILPALNLTLGFYKFGAQGMLENEVTDNRTAHIGLNYLGKKYLAHAGFIYNKVERTENGGAIDDDSQYHINWIRDTTVDAREIPVNLSEAKNVLKKFTVFLDQSYRIPLDFLRPKAPADTLAASDSLTAPTSEETPQPGPDTDITTAFIGHSSEFSAWRKVYTDKLSSKVDKAFYPHSYLNPSSSYDSLRVSSLENKLYLRLQPWKDNFFISRLDVGLGDRLQTCYMPGAEMYLSPATNLTRNSVYAYAGARGEIDRYFQWKAGGRLVFAGQEAGDFDIDGEINIHFFPFRKARKSPLTLFARASTALREPELYHQRLYTNHYRWNNNFGKSSETRVCGGLAIPHWDLRLEAGWSLLTRKIYFGTDGMIAQSPSPLSVFKIELRKNFAWGGLHLDNHLLAQYSTDESVLPLPYLSAHLRWYYQFNVVRNVMQMQIGVNARYFTSWYMSAWNPALGVFTNQTDYKYGNTPIFDAFINIQWKQCCLYFRLENAGMGWPMKSKDYFSAPHYILPQRALKIGITWPFYISHLSNPSVKQR